ncbi:capsid protein [Lutraria rhynchaena circular ssDNA virus]|nr:capsid protein [Lutraria rhynchaena circular ssDNA virus]
MPGMKRTRNGVPVYPIKRARKGVKSRSLMATYRAERMLNRRAVANKESGYVDLGVGTYAFNTTGAIALIPTVAQGTAVTQRVGKKIMWKHMQIRGIATADATTTNAAGAYLIVYDKRPTGSLPAVTDILDTANQRSFNNDANSGRFQILKRVDFSFVGNNATAGQSTAKTQYVINHFLDLKGKDAEYMAAGTGAIGDISLGALYIVTVGDQAAGTSDANLIVGFRTRFVDN